MDKLAPMVTPWVKDDLSSAQELMRQKTLLPKEGKGKEKATNGAKDSASSPTVEESDYEITRRDARVVYASNQAFLD